MYPLTYPSTQANDFKQAAKYKNITKWNANEFYEFYKKPVWRFIIMTLSRGNESG
jgi:hypothetical protein